LGKSSLIRFGGLREQRSVSLPLLVLDEDPVSPAYDAIYQPGAVACQPIKRTLAFQVLRIRSRSVAWKKAGESEWALRR